VIINLKNGEKIGGVYGPNSFASSFPRKEQVYLEQLWQVDKNGKFIQAMIQTNGVLVSIDEIKTIEFYNKN
jgi:hypothetical protein